jgi:hypothetical protein
MIGNNIGLQISKAVHVTVQTGLMQAHAILLNCSVDLPARAALANMKQWNGCHGCLYCKDKGS